VRERPGSAVTTGSDGWPELRTWSNREWFDGSRNDLGSTGTDPSESEPTGTAFAPAGDRPGHDEQATDSAESLREDLDPVVTPARPRVLRTALGLVCLIGLALAAAATVVVLVVPEARTSRRDTPATRPSAQAAAASAVTSPPADASAAPSAVAPGPREVSAQRDGRTEATFALLADVSRATVRSADLGDTLYRIASPPNSSVVPRVSLSADAVQLNLASSGTIGPGLVEVTLTSRVRWHLRLTGGASEHTVDMSAGGLRAIDLEGGAARVQLTLPAPQGTVVIRMTGGVDQFLIRVPRGAPVRARVRKGAGQVIIDGRTRRNVGPGSTFTDRSWETAKDRFDIDARAGVGTLRVDRG